MTTAATLQTEIAETIRLAREQGYTGTDRAYDLTDADLEAIVLALGRTPTRDEWDEAGYPYMSGTYVETMTACVYCGVEHSGDDSQPVPALTDDEAWTALAVEHADDCEWIATRAHKLD